MPSERLPIPDIGATLSGPIWPGRVRVVRVERRRGNRALIEAVTLDEASRLISRNLSREELAQLQVESAATARTLDGDPVSFKLAAEATRIRLAHTYDPQFAVSVARIDPLPHQLEAVYHYMLKQPRLRFLLADDPGAGKTILAEAVRRKENPVFLRRLKEDMQDFDGRPLFPPRNVETLGVELSEPEQQLYEDVTHYVTENFNRALAEEKRRHLDDLRRRQQTRLAETERTAVLALREPEILGVAAVIPAETWPVSRSPAGDVRYIEVKGRAGIGGVELSENEWLKAEQLGADYWLYIVADARNTAQLYLVQDPGHRLPREEVVPRVRYRVTRQGWDKVAERVVEYDV